jgi:cysteine-rich repeat protein
MSVRFAWRMGLVLGGLAVASACGAGRDYSSGQAGSGGDDSSDEAGAGADAEPGGGAAAGSKPAENGGERPSFGGTAGDPGASGEAGVTGDAGGGPISNTCGDGRTDPGEDCDLGPGNDADAYGEGQCTDKCEVAPYCGDGRKSAAETCDDGDVESQELGACNPECTGYYEKKFVRQTFNTYPAGALGGIAGADAKCVLEFGVGWKALLVGGGRRATVTPFIGDGAKDWVVKKYTHYFSYFESKLLWRTDELPLLGVRDGKRVNLYAVAFGGTGNYPWSGWADDWTTLPDNESLYLGTCAAWTSTSAGWATFTTPNLLKSQSESCSTGSFLLCVEQ